MAEAAPTALTHLPPELREELPVFTYGTLQRGFRNHARFVRGRAAGIVPARLCGARVWAYTSLGFPGLELLQPGDGGVVYGELLRLSPGTFAATLAELDALEEFAGPGHAGNVYERVLVEVEVATEAGGALDGGREGPGRLSGEGEEGDDGRRWARGVRAWVYVSLIDRGTTRSDLVESGDWARYMRERGLVDAADDWAASLAAQAAKVGSLVASPESVTTATPAADAAA